MINKISPRLCSVPCVEEISQVNHIIMVNYLTQLRLGQLFKNHQCFLKHVLFTYIELKGKTKLYYFLMINCGRRGKGVIEYI